MKLYYSSFTRAGRARWMLEEIGAPYDLVSISFATGVHKQPDYLAIHPNGVVPALVDGDLNIIESSAIVMYLADKYPDKNLAPPLGSHDRGHYYRWLVYIPATVDPVLETITAHTRLLPEDKRNPALAEGARKRAASLGKILENAVTGREFVVGNAFSGADVVVASAAAWMGFLGLLDPHPALAAYLKRMQARPAFKRAHEG